MESTAENRLEDLPTVDDNETNPAEANEKVICPQCGNTYDAVTRHFALSSSCSYPNLTPQQQEVLTGILLARGGIQSPNEGNGSVRVTDRNKEVLEWLWNQLGWLGGSVREKELDTFDEVDASPVGTTFELRTYSHPDFSYWRDRWYADDGSRRVPHRVTRTRRMIRATFALTGEYTPPSEESRAHVRVAFGRTKPDGETLRQLFAGFGPNITRELDHKTGTEQVQVRLQNVVAFFDYIGWNSVRGAEHNWPDVDEREAIKELSFAR